MRLDDLAVATGWRARLALDYARRAARSVLVAREHDGPLVVQKPLYPEGEAVCHTILVHPPAGIAGGDDLDIRVRARERAHVLLTTPGAAKWYRSAAPLARQRVVLEAAEDACIEWLPQETIVYDGALADMGCEVHLGTDARFIGWEVLCFGRTGSGERFTRGECRLATALWRDGARLWLERARIPGGASLLESPIGLGGRPICGTLVAAAPAIADAVLSACREVEPAAGEAAVTRLPGLLVARYLGTSSEAAKRYFAKLWSILRPPLAGRAAHEPRIWRT
jgi:urease accessory protein